MNVLVARHGETTWNLAGRYQGRRDSALTSLGMRQAFALADAAVAQRPAIARVVASPLLRTTATALPAAQRLDVPLEIDTRLIEIGHGAWEGRLRDEIAANDAERFRAWKSEPSRVRFDDGPGEADDLESVAQRWRAFVSEPVRVPTLVVTHDAVVRVAVVLAQGKSLDTIWDVTFENGAFARFDVAEDGAWRLLEPCVTAHLADFRAPASAQAL